MITAECGPRASACSLHDIACHCSNRLGKCPCASCGRTRRCYHVCHRRTSTSLRRATCNGRRDMHVQVVPVHVHVVTLLAVLRRHLEASRRPPLQKSVRRDVPVLLVPVDGNLVTLLVVPLPHFGASRRQPLHWCVGRLVRMPLVAILVHAATLLVVPPVFLSRRCRPTADGRRRQ